MDENFLATQFIKEKEYKRGFRDGYKQKEFELKDQRDKEIEARYQDSLKEDKGSEDYPLGGMIEPVDIEREKSRIK